MGKALTGELSCPYACLVDLGLVNLYHFDESIFSFRCFCAMFIFTVFSKKFLQTNSADPIQIPRLRRLNWVYTVFINPQNGYPVSKEVIPMTVFAC